MRTELTIFVNIFWASIVLAQLPRWEERMLDCTTKKDECRLIAKNAKIPRNPENYKCHTELMPNNIPLIGMFQTNSSTRLVCPIGCESEADLSVIQKWPIDNKNCQKYYTYGKYRDHNKGEWYLWLAKSCVANLTTHCRFNDVPISG